MKSSTCLFVFMLICVVVKAHETKKKETIKKKQNVTTVAATTEKQPAAASAVEVASSVAPVITTTRRPLLQGFRSPCSCLEGQCGCCTGTILDRFNQKACLNLTYEPDDFAITAAMSMNGKVLYRRSVSGKNPPPLCVNVPRLQFIRFCVQFSNIYFASRNVHLCIDAEANWQELTLLEWSFDCIRMGASGVAVVGPEDGGGVPANPIDSIDQTDEDYDDSARNALPQALHHAIVTKPSNKVIFDDSIKSAAIGKPDKTRIHIQKLPSGDFLISYDRNKA